MFDDLFCEQSDKYLIAISEYPVTAIMEWCAQKIRIRGLVSQSCGPGYHDGIKY